MENVPAVREFAVDRDELHNDSTTSTVHGDYESADRERTLRGRLRRAVTWGHNKDHRPDLKQLLSILTVPRDGAVPVPFRVPSGTAAADRSHRATWDLLGKRTGRRDFLDVADCKRATAANMASIHRHGGRFLSVLPGTRTEDAAVRAEILSGRVPWRRIHDKYDDDGELVDRFSIHEPERTSVAGYRLIGYHSTRKAERDALARQQRMERALLRLAELRAKRAAPRTRHRERAQVAQAVAAILAETGTEGEIEVTIEERTEETFRPQRRGRPNAATLDVQSQRKRLELTCRVDSARLAEAARCEGIFPLIRTEVPMSAKDLLGASKQPPMIEKRFAQLQTDFMVAPVYLKEVSRIQALLCVYFLALLVESLRERELRRAMESERIASLPLYPEGRACRRPTARKVIDLFEDVQRHELSAGRRPAVVFTTKLSRWQRKVLGLLGMSKTYDR